VTNTQRIQDAIDKQLCNSVLIKPNQIGTLTEVIDAIQLAHQNKLTTMISHRSGDTIDTFISDLAVASRSAYMKSGAPARAERVSKYNRLLEIFY
jgi:enolase